MLNRRHLLLASVAAGVTMSSRTVLAKASQPSTPVNFDVPAGAVDTHTHIHDPAKFPFFAGRVYTPEPASPEEMAALHKALHIQRVVIVTPSVYGTDNSATLFGMKARGNDARGVAVIDDKTTESELDALGKAGIRGVRINLKKAFEPFRCWPIDKCATEVGGATGIAEPDAALGLNLFQIGAPVGSEDKGDLVIAPRTGSKCEIVTCTNSAGITLRLIDGGRDVLASPLCFDNADKGQADKQCIVGRAACGGPFCNGEIAPFHRTCAGSVSRLLGIRFPSAIFQLLIDECPCFSLAIYEA